MSICHHQQPKQALRNLSLCLPNLSSNVCITAIFLYCPCIPWRNSSLLRCNSARLLSTHKKPTNHLSRNTLHGISIIDTLDEGHRGTRTRHQIWSNGYLSFIWRTMHDNTALWQTAISQLLLRRNCLRNLVEGEDKMVAFGLSDRTPDGIAHEVRKSDPLTIPYPIRVVPQSLRLISSHQKEQLR